MTESAHIDDERVQAYLEGLLCQTDAKAIEDHLSECTECRALAESYDLLSAALGRLDRPTPPADFTSGVLERIDERRRIEAQTSMAILGVAILLASALLALAGPAAWRVALSSVGGLLGSATSALHLGLRILPPLVNALQIEILMLFSSIALLILLCLSRILQPHRHKLVDQ